jgi:hypothetical protein
MQIRAPIAGQIQRILRLEALKLTYHGSYDPAMFVEKASPRACSRDRISGSMAGWQIESLFEIANMNVTVVAAAGHSARHWLSQSAAPVSGRSSGAT